MLRERKYRRLEALEKAAEELKREKEGKDNSSAFNRRQVLKMPSAIPIYSMVYGGAATADRKTLQKEGSQNLRLTALEEAEELGRKKAGEERGGQSWIFTSYGLRRQIDDLPSPGREMQVPELKLSEKATEELKREKEEGERLKKEREQRRKEERQASRLEALKEAAEELKREKAEDERLEKEREQGRENESEGLVRTCPFCKGSGVIDKGSTATCLVCKGKGVVTVKEPAVKCPVCQGKGRKSGSPVYCLRCRGTGFITVEEKPKEEKSEELVITCPFCNGRGTAKKGGTAACLVCKGNGMVRVKKPAIVCPVCQGAGRKSGSSVYCLRCRGTGFITVEAESPGKRREGGRPRELGDKELEGLRRLLSEKESWETKEVAELVKKEFDVKISMEQVRRILRNKLDMVFQSF